MNKQDCRTGMIVYNRIDDVRAVVIKCNPKNARVRILEDMSKSKRGSKAGSMWNIPYGLLDPVISENISTEMTMRSFENPENQAIKAYFANKRAEEPVDFPEGSHEWHIMRAVCELWRKLDDESIEEEAKEAGLAQSPALLRRFYSERINKLFSFLGREISKETAFEWESGINEAQKVS